MMEYIGIMYMPKAKVLIATIKVTVFHATELQLKPDNTF